jgi:RNA polymerase sigma-70 factor (ECF subfamily)
VKAVAGAQQAQSFPLDNPAEVLAPQTMADVLARRARVDGLVRAEQPLVWRMLRRLGLSRADADDAAQRVFIVLASRIDDVAPGSERAFLLRTASYIASKAYRTRRRSREVPEEEDAAEPTATCPSPEDIVHRRKLCEMLDRILEHLPPKFREVFVLCDVERLTAAEVGEILGLPQGTVASRLRTARELVASGLHGMMTRPAMGAGG